MGVHDERDYGLVAAGSQLEGVVAEVVLLGLAHSDKLQQCGPFGHTCDMLHAYESNRHLGVQFYHSGDNFLPDGLGQHFVVNFVFLYPEQSFRQR